MRASEIRKGEELAYRGQRVRVIEKAQPVRNWRGVLVHHSGLLVRQDDGKEWVIEAVDVHQRWEAHLRAQAERVRLGELAARVQAQLPPECSALWRQSTPGMGEQVINLHLTESVARLLLLHLEKLPLAEVSALQEEESALFQLLRVE